jgi:truncated hemoglobin YjbI
VSAPERPLAAEEHALSTDAEPTLYEWLGGEAVLRELTRVFYSRYVMADPLIGPLFAGMAPDHPDRVADWLGEVFGGPAVYSSEHGGYPRMISQHVGRQLTEAQRARWASLMLQAADDVALPADPEFRSAFVSYIEWGTRLALANSQTEARPPAHMPMPRWDWGTAGPPGGHRAARHRRRTASSPRSSWRGTVSRSASPGTSNRCSGNATGSPCVSPSICGRTRTSPRTPMPSWTD